jgi:tetratricopeptide (TPR) repeat protein
MAFKKASLFRNSRKGRRRPRVSRRFAWLKETRWQVGLILGGAIGLAGLLFSVVMLVNYSSTQDRIQQAHALMDEGKVAWAADSLKTITEEHPDSYTAWLYLGQCYLELNDVEQAEQAFESAMAIRLNQTMGKASKDPIAVLAKARLLRIKKRYLEAEKLLLESYELHPKNTELRQALWDLYYQWGYSRLEEGKPSSEVLPMFRKAQTFVSRYRYDAKLQAAISEALEKEYNTMLQKRATLQAKRAFLKEALTANYSHGLLSLAAELEQEQGQLNEALRYLKAAFTLRPELYALRYLALLEAAEKQVSASQHSVLAAEKARVRLIYQKANAQVPYPIQLSVVAFGATPEVDSPTEWVPNIQLRLKNNDNAPIPLLRLHLRLSSGGKLLSQEYHRMDKMGEKGSTTPADSIEVSLDSEDRISIQSLQQGRIKLEVFASFDVSQDSKWYKLYTGEKEVISPKQLEAPELPWEQDSLKTHPSQTI